MSPKLKPLLLPQLVEERRKRESVMESEMDLASSSFGTHNSSSSELPSPVTPTFSARGHFRYPSSTSSIDSTYHTSVMESPSSPTFVAKSGKRSLPDVQEEPQEREDDFDMIATRDDLYSCLCMSSHPMEGARTFANTTIGDSQNCLHRDPAMVHSSIQLSAQPEFDYDLAQGFFSDGEFSASSRSKKRRANDSAFNGIATRFGTRFPSFSRKFKLRRGASSTSLTSEALHDSNTVSSRSSSISNSVRRGMESPFDLRTPPTPTRSIYGRDDVVAPIDIERANRNQEELEESFATTPLLPPLMTDAAAHLKESAMQSPLQSPSVAEPRDPFCLSGTATPIDAISSSPHPSMPSPPLSTKPSISSLLHHRLPTSEIPSLPLNELPTDTWSLQLGHANFTIQPEPYIPATFTLSSCRQLRTDWDLARTNYTKHLVRTGEHYGATSSTYRLTEEKWAATAAIWRKNHDLLVEKTADSGSDAFNGLEYTVMGEQSRDLVTKIPSLNDGRGRGKFPQLGDGEIVGPMVKVAASSPALAVGGLKRSTSKKAKIMKFIADKFPTGLIGSSGKS